jgi:hypothetical protein
MKNILCFAALLGFINYASAQNTFPTAAGTNVGIGIGTPTTGKLVVNTGVASPASAIDIRNNGGGANNNAAITWAGGAYGFMDFNPNSGQGIRYSALGPLVFGSNTNAAYGSSIFAEAMRLTTTGNIGIGTTVPATKLDVNGAISIKGVNVNDSQSIAVATDGTYVVASGSRVKGTYTLTFEAANRVQTVVLLANANQFDNNSSLSILSNTSYNNAAVMSNFRLVFSSDNTVVYLVFDIANRNAGALISAYFNGTGFYNANWGGTLPGSPIAGGIYPLAVNMGNVSIGTVDSKGYKFAVNGSAIATSMTVKLNSAWPDYVFKKDYKLPTLDQVKDFIDQNQHLPDMPSEKEVVANGLNLGEMNKLLTKKVEELTLYLIELNSQLKEQQKEIQKLKNK